MIPKEGYVDCKELSPHVQEKIEELWKNINSENLMLLLILKVIRGLHEFIWF